MRTDLFKVWIIALDIRVSSYMARLRRATRFACASATRKPTGQWAAMRAFVAIVPRPELGCSTNASQRV
jgi:hypothetical protein